LLISKFLNQFRVSKSLDFYFFSQLFTPCFCYWFEVLKMFPYILSCKSLFQIFVIRTEFLILLNLFVIFLKFWLNVIDCTFNHDFFSENSLNQLFKFSDYFLEFILYIFHLWCLHDYVIVFLWVIEIFFILITHISFFWNPVDLIQLIYQSINIFIFFITHLQFF